MLRCFAQLLWFSQRPKNSLIDRLHLLSVFIIFVNIPLTFEQTIDRGHTRINFTTMPVIIR